MVEGDDNGEPAERVVGWIVGVEYLDGQPQAINRSQAD